jgi:RNA-directed DNA polymerase
MSAQDALVQLQAEIHRRANHNGRPVAKIFDSLLDRRNLDAALGRVRSADGADTPGPDGMTAAELDGRSRPWLDRLREELQRGAYAPMAPRWVDVPKTSGSGVRRLGILNIRDRVVHAAVKQVIEPLLEPIFLPHSYGFRPGRSVAGALDGATQTLASLARDALPHVCAVQLDVANCFDTIDHTILLNQLAEQVSDSALLELIGRLLQVAGTTKAGWWWRRRTLGLVQGGALSPLLCNLYLHPLDVALAELRRQSQHAVTLLRYADDLLLLARDVRLARQAVSTVRGTLGQLGQQLCERKSRVVTARDGVDWLGVRIQPRPVSWTGRVEFGYVVPDDRVRRVLDRITEMTTAPSPRIDAAAFDLGRWLVSINDQLREWRQAYVFADNGPIVFRAIDEHTRERVAELLHSVTGLRRSALYARYWVRLPRGFATWEVNGTRLVVLSSLAPERPRGLTRSPPWLRVPPGQSAAAKHSSPANDAPPRETKGD